VSERSEVRVKEKKKSERCETENSTLLNFPRVKLIDRTLLRHQMLAREKKEIEKERLRFNFNNKSEVIAMKSESFTNTTHLK